MADEETDALELLSAMLARHGAEIRTKKTVSGAIELIGDWQPDVIIYDIELLEENGYSFIRKVRALPPEKGGTIPAVALTAYAGAKEQAQALSGGFQKYLSKPFESSELIQILAALTRERIQT